MTDNDPSVWESLLCLVPAFVLAAFIGYHAVIKVSEW